MKYENIKYNKATIIVTPDINKLAHNVLTTAR